MNANRRSVMECPHCKKEHPQGTKYCSETGKQMSVLLNSCPNVSCENYGKNIIPTHYKFCPECGTILRSHVETDNKNTNSQCECHEYNFIDSFHDGRAVVKKKEQFGIIDIDGKEVVPCMYHKILRFSEGLAACQKESDNWSFIDLNGDIVIYVPDGIYITSEIGFKEGVCAVFGETEDGLKYGYINKSGELIIDLQYNYASDFCEGLASVYNEDEDVRFYIDLEGNRCFPYNYSYCGNFVGNKAVVQALHGKHFAIDKNGEILFKFNTKSFWHHVDSKFISYGLEDKYLWFDPDNQTNHFVFKNIKMIYNHFNEGLAAVCSSKNNKWGFISEKAELLIPFIYDEAHDFNEGLAAVRMNDKWGFVNPDGQMVIEPSYDEVFDFGESRAVVKLDEKYFVIDKYGNRCF